MNNYERLSRIRVHCLMLTSEGRDTSNGIEEFENQKYNKKELHIVKMLPGETIGDARNRALDLVPDGDAFCQWDDDDWRDDLYLRDMAEYLDYTGHVYDAVTVARETLRCVCKQEAKSMARRGGKEGYWEHSAVFRKAAVRIAKARYPSVNLGEDTEFMRQFMEAGAKIYVHKFSTLYTYICTGRNLTSVNHWDRLFALAESSHRPSWCCAARKLGHKDERVLATTQGHGPVTRITANPGGGTPGGENNR